MNTAMILCAGFGTRMCDLTKDTPKPMLSLGNATILEHNIKHLVGLGINKLIINLHYLPDKITSCMGDGSALGAKILYSHESSPLGTAGAVKKAECLFGGEHEFLVLYGDIVSDENYLAMHGFHSQRPDAVATIALHERASSNSVVEMDKGGRLTRFIERPETPVADKKQNWVNSGMYLFRSSIFGHIPEGVYCDFPKDVFTKLVDAGKIYGYPITGYRCAIDSPERYAKACADYSSGLIYGGRS